MKLIKYFTIAIAALAFAACGGDDTEGGKQNSSGVVLKAHNNSVEVNTPIHFSVIASDGTDLTAEAIIFDKTNDYAVVSNPFIPTKDGEHIFFASVNNMNTPYLTVNVVPSIPELPADAEPSNTSFNHRILLVDHTGNTCGNCPQMMLALKEIMETQVSEGEVSYHDRFCEAMAHSYTTGDNAYSRAAGFISTHYSVTAYPTVTYNFYHSTTSPQNAAHIKGQINSLWKAEGAEAGIAATSIVANTCVVVNTEVKAAVKNEYHITAWLLEDNIYAKQTNATEDWMNYHDNAIRQRIVSDDITGVDLGTIEAGETATTTLTLKIESDKWVRENFKVLLIVSAKNAKGKFEVANSVICPANESVVYDYKKN